MMRRFVRAVRRFDERRGGEMPIGPILIIALVVLPLLFILIMFRDDVTEYLNNEWGATADAAASKKTFTSKSTP